MILIIFLTIIFSFLDYLLEAEPEFAEPINNVTVAIGRDAHLSCTVENLGTYRVS